MHVRVTTERMGKGRARGCEHQYLAIRRFVDCQTQKLLCCKVHPVKVFKNYQYRFFLCLAQQRVYQCAHGMSPQLRGCQFWHRISGARIDTHHRRY